MRVGSNNPLWGQLIAGNETGSVDDDSGGAFAVAEITLYDNNVSGGNVRHFLHELDCAPMRIGRDAKNFQ